MPQRFNGRHVLWQVLVICRHFPVTKRFSSHCYHMIECYMLPHVRNFAKLTGKHLCQSLFFNKDAWDLQQVFPGEFCEISKTTVIIEHFWWLPLYFQWNDYAKTIASLTPKNLLLNWFDPIEKEIWISFSLHKNLCKKVFKNCVNFISSKLHWKISDFLKYFEYKIRDCDQISFLILSKFKRIDYITFFFNTYAFSTIWNHLWWFQG